MLCPGWQRGWHFSQEISMLIHRPRNLSVGVIVFAAFGVLLEFRWAAKLGLLDC
ncbi:hypothetical protein RRSWK_01583 [Rhodopirellula sp. SWK7]|nr:hypothetical protein RRSWK_01583 [Rhodopirellula sp. SWK7]